MSSKHPEEFERYQDLVASRHKTFPWRPLLLPIGAVIFFVGSMIVRHAGADDPVETTHFTLAWRFQMAAYHLFPEVELEDLDCDTSQAPLTPSGDEIVLTLGDTFSCVYTEVKADGQTVEHPLTMTITETRHEYRRRRADRQVFYVQATAGQPGIATTFPEAPRP